MSRKTWDILEKLAISIFIGIFTGYFSMAIVADVAGKINSYNEFEYIFWLAFATTSGFFFLMLMIATKPNPEN